MCLDMQEQEQDGLAKLQWSVALLEGLWWRGGWTGASFWLETLAARFVTVA